MKIICLGKLSEVIFLIRFECNTLKYFLLSLSQLAIYQNTDLYKFGSKTASHKRQVKLQVTMQHFHLFLAFGS